jgi:hypothetical protein
MNELSEMNPLFQVTVTCLCCEATYQTSRVRPSFKKGKFTDTDFCVYYRDDLPNPDYYVIRVCPYCGFACSENFSPKMEDRHRRKFYEQISSKWEKRDYGGERTWQDALDTYKLALLCAQIKEEKERVIAGLLHHIAWLYRYKNMTEMENRFLQFALNSYIKVYEVEGPDIDNARLMYLIGELNRRLKNYNEAVKWFARVVNDKEIMDAAIIRRCREMWALIREEMNEEKQL